MTQCLTSSQKSMEQYLPKSVPEHGVVSVGSPMQSLPPNKGAVQARARDFLAHEQEGSQWDHSPHSCHSPSIPG